MTTTAPQRAPVAPLDLRLALPAATLWCGCIAGLWQISWWVTGSILTLGVTITGWRWVRYRSPHTILALILAACALGGLFLGLATASQVRVDPVNQAAAAGAWITTAATITADPVETQPAYFNGLAPADLGVGVPTTYRLSARAHAVTVAGKNMPSSAAMTLFVSGAQWANLPVGSVIRVSGTVTENTFSVVAAATMRVRSELEILAPPPAWQRWASPTRQALANIAATLPADQGGLLRGLVVGDTRGISPELSLATKITGLTHLVAVSGTHMAIAAGAVLVVVRRAGPRWSALGAGTMIVAMVILVGPQPSVLRSSVMAAIGLTAAVAGRSRSSLPALAAAVIILLLYDPTLALQMGFVLSVQATAGLILLAPVWARALENRGVPPGWALFIAVPTAAHIVTIPVIAAMSGRISLVAILANMAVTPVVAPALLLGLLCAALAPWWTAGAGIIARMDQPLLAWITGTARHLADWPWASISFSQRPVMIVALAAALVIALILLQSMLLRLLTLAIVLGFVIILLPAQVLHPGWPHDNWVITVCDVGQGDAIVVSAGASTTAIVIDTGPDPALIDRCLTDLGVTHIALVAITHLHADHYGGLSGVLAGRHVRAIGLGTQRQPAQGDKAVTTVAHEYHVPIMTLAYGDQWLFDDVAIEILGPTRRYFGTESDPNNASLVMRVTKDDIRMLLTGDIELAAQNDLLRSGHELSAEILKAPHHGSAKLLPALVTAVQPQAILIGVGHNNSYGHPAPSALAVFGQAGTVLRTDTDGDVQVTVVRGALASLIRGK